MSHTTPLTVAAELGLVGFALYVFLLLAAIGCLLLRETLPTLALALGAVLLALFTHSLAWQVLRGSDHLAHSRRGRRISRGPGARQGTGTGPRRQRDDREPTTCADQVTRREAGASSASWASSCDHGARARIFRRGRSGALGRNGSAGAVRVARESSRPGLRHRAAAVDALVAGVVVAQRRCSPCARRTIPRAVVAAICAAVVDLLILPAALLRSACATRPSRGTTSTTRRTRSRSPAT